MHLFKPLFDGIIAAMHTHDGRHMDVVAPRLAHRLETDERVIRDLLSRGEAILGARSVIHPWGNSIQWNPADDRLVFGQLSATPADGNAWTIDGEVCGLTPLPS